MQQIKLFTGTEEQTEELETQVNDWIQNNTIKVISITGNISPQSPQPGGDDTPTLSKSRFSASDILIVVTYEA